MKKDKAFDCVEMKQSIQAQMLEDVERLSPEEASQRRNAWLAEADDALAEWWRRHATTATADAEQQ